jgi:hypothetical protein
MAEPTPLTTEQLQASFLHAAENARGTDWLVKVHAAHPIRTMTPFVSWQAAGDNVHSTLPLVQWEFVVLAGMRLAPDYEHVAELGLKRICRSAVGPAAVSTFLWMLDPGLSLKACATPAAYERHVHKFLDSKKGIVGHNMDLTATMMVDLPGRNLK